MGTGAGLAYTGFKAGGEGKRRTHEKNSGIQCGLVALTEGFEETLAASWWESDGLYGSEVNSLILENFL